jgi:hypothetical protein
MDLDVDIGIKQTSPERNISGDVLLLLYFYSVEYFLDAS